MGGKDGGHAFIYINIVELVFGPHTWPWRGPAGHLNPSEAAPALEGALEPRPRMSADDDQPHTR